MKEILRTTGFEKRRFVPIDIRGTDIDGMLARLRAAVEQIVQQQAAPQPASAP